MTVIDYLPEGEEVKLNVLFICSREKSMISKVMAALEALSWINIRDPTTTTTPPCLNNSISAVFVMAAAP